MKISIITVCVNSAAAIGDTMRSVVTQTHRDIEHIIVDSASKDDTPAIIQATASRSLCFISEPDAGIHDAMNKGLQLATGISWALLNADDMLADPHTIARIATAAMEREADAVYGGLSHVLKDRPGEVIPGIRVAYLPEVLVHLRTGGASNHSLRALMKKSREDLAALEKNRVGGIATLLCKSAKMPQHFLGSRPGPSSTRAQ
jgi:glycosyltransferase involved in cell wall biosynthesis